MLFLPENQAELLFSFQSSPSIPVHLFRKLLFSFPGKSFFSLSELPLKKKERKKYSILATVLTHRAWLSCFFLSFFVYSVPRDWRLIPTLSSRALRLWLAKSRHRRDFLKNLFTSTHEREDENTAPRAASRWLEGLQLHLFYICSIFPRLKSQRSNDSGRSLL